MSAFSNLLILPLLIFFIQADYLGLWYVFVSIGAVVILFDFGFNPTLSRNIAYVWSGAKSLLKTGAKKTEATEPNFPLLKKTQKICRILYLIIAFAAAIVLLACGTPYLMYLAKGLDQNVVLISWLIYTLAVTLNLYYGYFATFLRGVGAVEKYNKILVLARSVQLVLAVALLICGWGLLAPCIAYLAYGFLLRILCKRSYFKYKNIGKNLSQIKEKVDASQLFELFKTIWHNAWRDGFVSLSNYLTNQATVIVASAFLTLAETGVYSISIQLVTAIVTVASVKYTALQPAMQSAYVGRDREKATQLMSNSTVTMTFIYFFLLAILCLLGAPLLSLIQPDVAFNPYVILGLGIYFYLYKRQALYASFISNTNRIPYVFPYFVSGIIGVILSIIFVSVFKAGVWGMIAGQLLPQLVYNCWKWPYAVRKMLKVNFFNYIKVGLSSLFKARY